MFHEYRDLITELKTSDRYFQNLFEKHNTLDQKIKNMKPTWSRAHRTRSRF